MSSNNKYIVIATGGTGGHIFPALGLANYLNSVGFNSVLTSDKRGLNLLTDIKNLNFINIPSSENIKPSKLKFFGVVLIK